MPERDDLQTGNGTSSVVGSRQWRQVLRDVDEVVAGCRLIPLSKKIKLNLDKNLKKECKYKFNKMGRKIYY